MGPFKSRFSFLFFSFLSFWCTEVVLFWFQKRGKERPLYRGALTEHDTLLREDKQTSKSTYKILLTLALRLDVLLSMYHRFNSQ